jgi:hypothetical protein
VIFTISANTTNATIERPKVISVAESGMILENSAVAPNSATVRCSDIKLFLTGSTNLRF